MNRAITLILATLIGFSASANDFAQTRAKLEAALQSDLRTKQDKSRDANRKPIETLEFFGFRDDMKVLELVPGSGWYTKLLAPVLKEHGEYYTTLNANRVKERLFNKPGFEKAVAVETQGKYWRDQGSALLTMKLESLGVEDLDMVLTFRNYHNFNETGRKELNREVFESLKPGGIYGLVSHTARHMEPASHENNRRIDPVVVIKEIIDAGFEFVDYSDLHYQPSDDLTKEVADKSLKNVTDRWTLKFRKPLK